MDTAFSGYIGVAEVRAMFQRAGGFIAPATEAELDAMIREADLDGDGRLSLEEFKHVVEQCS
jgi:Ca2+-binding EF-hand superfamily protein